VSTFPENALRSMPGLRAGMVEFVVAAARG